MLPDAKKKIGILYTTSETNSVSTQKIQAKSRRIRFELVEKGITNAMKFQAVDLLVSEVDCISNMTNNTVVENLPYFLKRQLLKTFLYSAVKKNK